VDDVEHGLAGLAALLLALLCALRAFTERKLLLYDVVGHAQDNEPGDDGRSNVAREAAEVSEEDGREHRRRT
jgi:hypothetical protein